MHNVLCWSPDGVTSVINIEADAMPAAIFRAVDTDTPVQCKEGEHGSPLRLSTDALVARFTDRGQRHIQMAVLGPAGAGKSHLIRRLQQRIEGREGLEVLVIQRLETNLRAILEKLIGRLPVADRAKYQDDLAQAGYALTSADVQKSALLDGLAQAIQDDGPRGDSGMEREAEQWLLQHLPDLLRDPYLRREKFLKAGEIIPELVERLFSAREGKRLEERVVFTRENLPLSGVRLEQCAGPVREVVEYCLYDQETTVPPVLTVLNRNLDRAIARTLNFSGERLAELMDTLRRRLHGEGRQLVLLFEEFARLQGYDSAMLEALLKRGGDGLCDVRWAIACTSGRFRDLPDTVRTRMDLVVDMEGAPPKLDLQSFSGRYLNAVRLGGGALEAAYAADPSGEIGNACEGCPARQDCHLAFGTDEHGHGLYPFTSEALRVMALRADPEADVRFNPRTFQRSVLRMVLADEGRQIAMGAFPSLSLLQKLGGPEIGPAERVLLREKAGGEFDRYLSLLQFWSGGQLANPPDGVLTAFGLRPLSGLNQSPSPLSRTDPAVEAATEAPRPTIPAGPAADPHRAQLGAWVDGGFLDQTLARTLREKLFPLVEAAIDWDVEGLSPTLFSSPTGSRPFRRASLNFSRQGSSGAQNPPVALELPLRRDEAGFTETARALDVLLAYDSGGWEAVGGLEALAAVQELVSACAAEVVRQLKALRAAGEAWDPVVGAVELLLIGAGLGGRLNARTDDDGLVEAVFAAMQEENAAAEGPLRSVYDLLKRRRPDLQTLVRAHVSGSKGGRQGRFIDPRPVLAAARRLRRSKWVLSATAASLKPPFADVGATYEKVAADLRPALLQERDRRLQWLARIEEAFGEEADRQVILKSLDALLDATLAGGLPARRTAVNNAKAAFATVQFGDAVRATRTLRDAEVPEAELAAFARGRADAMGASDRLAEAWRDFLTETKAEVAAQAAQHGVMELEAELKALDGALSLMDAELGALELPLVSA